jgi:saxitoxin biosynthesis operon SxtJ-like protein
MNQPVDKRELRSFGLLVGSVFGVIGVWPALFRGEPLRLWAAALGGALIFVGVVLPKALAPIHKGWMWLGHILGWINTRILLGIVFYGLITPIGIAFRLMGKDTMRRAFVQDCPTYRVCRKPRPRGHMRYQF